MQKNVNLGVKSIILVLVLVFASSCVPVKKLKYFNDLNELQEPVVNPKEQKVIMPFDKLYIKVYSIDDRTNQLFNANENMSMGTTTNVIGYNVDETGNINYPFAGKVNIGGLSLAQAGSTLEKALNVYGFNTTINIKFIDNNVTVMGEVQREGRYAFSQDKLTIYEALALGGGITQYGDRKNVILVRQEGDKIMHHSLNLSDSKIDGKEVYYIQANDIIIVEPMKFTSWYKFNNTTFSTILSSLTTFLAIFVIIRSL